MLPRLAAYLGQPFCYDEGGVVGLKGGRRIALSTKHVADLFLEKDRSSSSTPTAWGSQRKFPALCIKRTYSLGSGLGPGSASLSKETGLHWCCELRSHDRPVAVSTKMKLASPAPAPAI